jgi:His-Xaa-Ser system protein HxsD
MTNGRQEHIGTKPSVCLELDPSVYRLSAVKKAAYKFLDRCHVQISCTPEGTVRVNLRPLGETVDRDSLADAFLDEALDQELRELVAGETAAVRDLLLAQAFSAISLVDRHGDDASYADDPLAIQRSAVPPPKASDGAE